MTRLLARLIACVALWTSPALAQQDSIPAPQGRIEQLDLWLNLVEGHELGVADVSVLELRSWDPTRLRRVWIDFSSLINMVREPRIGIFFEPVEPRPDTRPGRRPILGIGVSALASRRSRQIRYSLAELRSLRALAERVTERGDESELDRIIKRSAALHLDVAMVGPDGMAHRALRPPGTSAVTLFVADGQQAGLDDSASHWEMGRLLLDRVRPTGSTNVAGEPEEDDTVRLWYVVAAAAMQASEQFEPWHVERALQLFPDDSDILFFAACQHEGLSTPHFQKAMQSANLPRDVSFDVGSEGAELRAAERLYRRALDRNPTLVEARIRLGRVLGRRDRHTEAARELRQAVTETDDPLLLYYANMFLGAEAEALGRAEEARGAYLRAATLYPAAQSPPLALSAMASRAGDRAEAFRHVDSVLNRESADFADDPWWSYRRSHTRAISTLVAELHRRVQELDRP